MFCLLYYLILPCFLRIAKRCFQRLSLQSCSGHSTRRSRNGSPSIGPPIFQDNQCQILLCCISEMPPPRLSHLTKNKNGIVVETRRNRPRIVRNRFVPVCGYRAGYLGLVWPSFRPTPGSKSMIPGRILKSFRGPFSSAEIGALKSVSRVNFR